MTDVLTVDLKDDPAAIEAYRRLREHGRPNGGR